MLDPFYSAELLRETAAGIPNARLTLDDGTGHAMLGKDFQGELLRFLSADDIDPLGPRRRRPDLPHRARDAGTRAPVDSGPCFLRNRHRRWRPTSP